MYRGAPRSPVRVAGERGISKLRLWLIVSRQTTARSSIDSKGVVFRKVTAVVSSRRALVNVLESSAGTVGLVKVDVPVIATIVRLVHRTRLCRRRSVSSEAISVRFGNVS